MNPKRPHPSPKLGANASSKRLKQNDQRNSKEVSFKYMYRFTPPPVQVSSALPANSFRGRVTYPTMDGSASRFAHNVNHCLNPSGTTADEQNGQGRTQATGDHIQEIITDKENSMGSMDVNAGNVLKLNPAFTVKKEPPLVDLCNSSSMEHTFAHGDRFQEALGGYDTEAPDGAIASVAQQTGDTNIFDGHQADTSPNGDAVQTKSDPLSTEIPESPQMVARGSAWLVSTIWNGIKIVKDSFVNGLYRDD